MYIIYTASGICLLKFCVLCCLVLVTFIFNIFVTNESMYIVMMIEKKQQKRQETYFKFINFVIITVSFL